MVQERGRPIVSNINVKWPPLSVHGQNMLFWPWSAILDLTWRVYQLKISYPDLVQNLDTRWPQQILSNLLF